MHLARGRAVQFDEWSLASQTMVVKGTSNDFLACAGFALDQRDGVASRDDPNLIQHVLKCGTVTNDVTIERNGGL